MYSFPSAGRRKSPLPKLLGQTFNSVDQGSIVGSVSAQSYLWDWMGVPDVHQRLYRPCLALQDGGGVLYHHHPEFPGPPRILRFLPSDCWAEMGGNLLFQTNFPGRSLHVPSDWLSCQKKLLFFLLLFLLFLSIQLPRQSFLKAPDEPGPFLPPCPPLLSHRMFTLLLRSATRLSLGRS